MSGRSNIATRVRCLDIANPADARYSRTSEVCPNIFRPLTRRVFRSCERNLNGRAAAADGIHLYNEFVKPDISSLHEDEEY